MISRRALVGVVALGAAPAIIRTAHDMSTNPSPRTLDPDAAPLVTSLRECAASRGLLYGAAAGKVQIERDPVLSAAFAKECGVLTPENELKWETLRPSEHEYDFAPADRLLDYARQNGMAARGHTLVWHQQLPSWLRNRVSRSDARQLLLEHIATVCGRYAGRFHSWDVVNEAVETENRNMDGLRPTVWLRKIGPSYIELAFRAAASADPKAILCYNEYGLELDVAWQETRRRRVLRLLSDLKAVGAPVHALGLQSHLEVDAAPFSAAKFRAFLDDVAALGLNIQITELDVSDKNLRGDTRSRDAAVGRLYGEYLDCVLGCPATRVVMTWGLSDRYSWLNSRGSPKRSDGLPIRSLPLDANMERKQAYTALADSLTAAPSRT